MWKGLHGEYFAEIWDDPQMYSFVHSFIYQYLLNTSRTQRVLEAPDARPHVPEPRLRPAGVHGAWLPGEQTINKEAGTYIFFTIGEMVRERVV